MFSFAHREATRKGRVRLVCFLFLSPHAGQYRNMNVSCCSIVFPALLCFPGFSTGRDSVAEHEASLSEPSETRLLLFLICVDVPAGWYDLCNYPQLYLLHSGSGSCFVGCGSPCNPGSGQCQVLLALCWPCAGGRSTPRSLLGHCFSCLAPCPSFGITLGPSAAPGPICSSISVCAGLRCTSIPLHLLLQYVYLDGLETCRGADWHSSYVLVCK